MYGVLISNEKKDSNVKRYHVRMRPARFNSLHFHNIFAYLGGDRTPQMGRQVNVKKESKTFKTFYSRELCKLE